MVLPLHATEPAGIDPAAVVVGALVAVVVWRAIRWFSRRQSDRRGDGW